jgi:cytosine permease
MSNLPDYIASAKPATLASRVAWYKTVAPTYAGVMLWFVFWKELVKGYGTPGGVLSSGIGAALIGLLVAALICHFLFYLVPGLLGMQTGLPLYIVGSSTYGARGSLFMPGLLMGLLQFGWLAVNGLAVSDVLCQCFKVGLEPDGIKAQIPGIWHGTLATIFIFLAAFVGLKGIQYVGRVATWLPLIPLVVLIILVVKTAGGLADFTPEKLIAPAAAAGDKAAALGVTSQALGTWGVIAVLCTYVVGFFATAGAAGTDIASSTRNESDVHWGGMVGIVLATLIAGGAAILVIAGVYGSYQAGAAHNLIAANHLGNYSPVEILEDILGKDVANLAMIGLAISSFPGACFSALIAANSFKTTMPKINPLASVGIGALVAAILAVTGIVAKVIWVFEVIGASFGPICGAMLADYLLAGKKWNGPRAGFNPAGWLSWLIGFGVGAFNLLAKTIPDLDAWKGFVPCPPVSAFVVGFVLYVLLTVLGVKTRTLDMPPKPTS